MGSLDKIQKIIKVFHILAKIAMIFAYVASGLLFVSAILLANNTSCSPTLCISTDIRTECDPPA